MAKKSRSSFSGLSLISKLELEAQSGILGILQRPNGKIIRSLANLSDAVVTVPPSRTPQKGVVTSDIIFDASRRLWFRLFVPVSSSATDTSIPVIVYFHGGGFALLSPKIKHFDRLCRTIAREVSAVVISVHYRRSPEYKFPSQCEDGFDALKFIDQNKLDGLPMNANLKCCFIAGDSAGGNLTHHVAVRASGYEFKEVKIEGLILIQPFFGGEARTDSELRFKGSMPLKLKATDWFWKAFLPEGSSRDHPASNVSGPASISVSNLVYPPALLIVGGQDILQDWQRRYYDWLKKWGKEVELVEYYNMFHGFYGFPELQESSMLISEIKSFVQKRLCMK